MSRTVFIATPTMSGDLCHEYVYGLLETQLDLIANRNITPVVQFIPGNCYVALARNQLVRMFLESGCDDLLFIDADLGFKGDAAWKVLEPDKDIVCGLYPFKTDAGGFPARYIIEHGDRIRSVNGLIQMDGAPTGFMRIKRSVIERMIAKFPEREYVTHSGAKEWDLFPCERVKRPDGKQDWFGEDYRFCHLAKEAGCEVWVVPNLEFQHVGRRAYSGNWHEFMIREAARIVKEAA